MAASPAPLVSVVIPTRNRPAALRSCLAALAACDPVSEGVEVLVVDDGGTVDLGPVVDGADLRGRLRVLRRTHAGGPGAARNDGAAAARGTLLAFTDDDCRPGPGWLTALVGAHTREPDALLGGTTRNGLQGELWSDTAQLVVDVSRAWHLDRGGPPMFPSNNLAAARARFVDVGGFDVRLRIASEDRDLCDRWVMAGLPFRSCPDAVVEHDHAMDLREFVRVHRRYGVGAAAIADRRARRAQDRGGDPGPILVGVAEHLDFLGSFRPALGALPLRRRPATVGALGVWQAANAIGFLSARTMRGPTPVDN